MRSAVGVPVITAILAFASLATVSQETRPGSQDESRGRHVVAASEIGHHKTGFSLGEFSRG